MRAGPPNSRKRRCIAGGLFLAIAGIVMATGLLKAPSHAATEPAPVLADARVRGGSLMIVGGGAVTPEIRKRFVELAGGANARIMIIPGSDQDAEGQQRLLSPWHSSGALSVALLNARNRSLADDPQFCAPLKTATGVWFGGGYQSLLAERYVDTLLQRRLHELLERSGVVGGCSAGAALLSRVMIRDGDTTPIEARGLDLISDAIVDQHFLRRNRVWRLQQMLQAHPNLVGLGIDEATALVVELRDWRVSVVGESYVMVWLPGGSSGPARRVEVLNPGDDVLLSQLRADHLAYHAPLEPGAPAQ